MTRLEDRQTLLLAIAQAHAEGARLAPACALAGIDPRTRQRWQGGGGPGRSDEVRADRRPEADRPTPMQALSAAERAQIIAVANEPRFADTPPARIVPALADEGVYIASEASFHRVLRAHGQMSRRGRACLPRASRPPTTHIATRPGEVWCWDVTFLPAVVQGRWFYLYLILDLYSRKIVGFEVHDSDTAEHAAHLARRTALAEGVHARPVRPVLHGDNGATLKATTVLAMLNWLGIKPSYSRPRVSDDNSFAEAVFRTAKYRPEFPAKGFADLEEARAWAARFVHWYNHEHRHSGIRYVTPAQRHAGEDGRLLGARHAVYQTARERQQRCPDLIVPETVWHEPWIAHVTAWGRGEQAVLDYLARYVFRIAITNARIVGLDDAGVTFTHRDRKTGRRRTCRLSGEEFMRRFLQHVLPRGFHKVRYFGLWHPAHRQDAAGVRQMLQLQAPPPTGPLPESAMPPDLTEVAVAPAIEPRICPHCHQGRLIFIRTFARSQAMGP